MKWLHQWHHLVHIDAGPHQPHTKGRSPNHNQSKSDAFRFRNVCSLLDEERGGYHAGNKTNHKESDRSGDEAMSKKALRLSHLPYTRADVLEPRQIISQMASSRVANHIPICMKNWATSSAVRNGSLKLSES